MEDNTFYLLVGCLVIIGIIGLAGTLYFGAYKYHQIEIDNFQKTINNLSDEQKCLHICGFQWEGPSLLENYKFCVEKCDRISERLNDN